MSTESIELRVHDNLPPLTTDVPEAGFIGEEQDQPRYFDIDDSVQQPTSLAPVDRGFSAWSFIIAAFLIEVLVWGFPNSFGVLLAAYLSDSVYTSQKHADSTLPLIGTLCTGVMYCSGLVIYPLMHYFPHVRRYFTWTGTIICTLSLLGASFTTKVTALLALQGVLYAIGGSLAYAPVVSYLSEWFVQRRGLANGIMFCGAAAGGILFPIVLPPLITKFGVMKTIRGFSIAFLIGMIPALLFMKARLPVSRVHGPRPRAAYSRSWLKDRNFWFFLAINTVQGFGYFVPLTWLPTYASSFGLSSAQGSLSLALFNAFAGVSCSFVGFLSDKHDVWILTLASLVLTSLATFLIVYGTVAGSFSSLWSAFVKPVAKDDSSLATTIFGYMLISRGIGNILSTPIATALQQVHRAILPDPSHKSGFTVAGGRYQDMIIYAGTCFAGAALIALVDAREQQPVRVCVCAMDNIELAVHTPLPPSTLHLAAASTSTLRLPADLPSSFPKSPKEDAESVVTLAPEPPVYDEYDVDTPKYESSLAPVDRGFAAWSLLFSSFMIEVLVWGFPNSFGVLLAAYLDDPVYNSQPGASSTLPLVGTLCTGIMYCSALVVYPTMHYYPPVTLLVVLQGVVFAIGGSLVYAPVVSYMSEWFVKRRGLANGIVFMGSNMGGVIFPLIIPRLIARYGIHATIRIYAVAFAIALFPVLPFMKARLPESRVHGPGRRSAPKWASATSCLSSGFQVCLQLANLILI
ncbi:hypothetical protein NM688_g5556 [Phlebia brevispora]|uniref:Uncharacterized protein n=1 Tax=Phlebia brevispora TaxID=194682 RepID=A0ACC1STN3_9APHY|nr:hypothetical protein NM688_g5556 [Phlebia brevispora]